MSQDNWEPCPRCGSNRVQPRGTLFLALVGVGLIGISLWLLIIPPVGIAGILLGILFIIVAPLSKGMVQCQDCNYSWKFPYIEKKNEEEIREK